MIFIKDKLTTDESYSTNEFLAALGICLMLKKDECVYYSNINALSFLLTRSLPVEPNLSKNLIDGINGLKDKGLISLNTFGKRNEWIIEATAFINVFKLNDKDFYTAIDEEHIEKILKLSKTYYMKSISIVRFYSYLLTTISKTGDKKGVGFLNSDDMSYHTNLHKNTILNYLKVLEKLKIIYVYRPNDYIIFQTGNIVEIGNTYGRYQDKDIVISMGSEFAETYGEHLKIKHKRLDKSVANKTRGYSHKFRHLKKRIEQGLDPEYTYDECKEIYLAMRDLNARYIKEGNNERLKDLSVFKTYDFYVEK